MKKSHFDICKEMANENKEIIACTTLIRANKNKRGGEFVMGVAEPYATKVILEPDKYMFQLLIINADEYEAIKNA